MENINAILASNIASFRKQKALTQEKLAVLPGVSYQAVSKWENEKSLPDITILPILADTFDCTIDELFSRKYTNSNCITWDDDDKIRGVVYKGRHILEASNPNDLALLQKFTFEVDGDAKSIECQCNVTVSGSVSCGVNANGEVTACGHISGGVNSCGDVTAGFNLSGGVNANGDVCAGKDIIGEINTTRGITVKGNVSGNIECDGKIQVEGNVDAGKITGNVICNELKCERVEGSVTINK
ncbi:MAG: helix-turn-helix domain-containing protein [Clostridia bacterium]|nr:helix-turn-helix domain-containing protein [Clostridia bacterium]